MLSRLWPKFRHFILVCLNRCVRSVSSWQACLCVTLPSHMPHLSESSSAGRHWYLTACLVSHDTPFSTSLLFSHFLSLSICLSSYIPNCKNIRRAVFHHFMNIECTFNRKIRGSNSIWCRPHSNPHLQF